MRREEFEVLRDLAEGKNRETLEHGECAVYLKNLVDKGIIDSSGITRQGMMLLEKYRVNNAIIMSAGYSARCMPLSTVLPKGLFRIKGEVMIEREIKQLIEAGIEQIIVITGFMKEKFEYLQDKYGVLLMQNDDFDKYNNMSSLYVAQDYISNSYILCSDNYYEENVFHKYVYSSYYSCIYSDSFCDEYFVTEEDQDNTILDIQRGGERAWYTIGDAYFDRDFSRLFVDMMNKEWDNIHVRNMLMDDFYLKHIKELKMRKVERTTGSILEFDTLEEIKQFDPDFSKYMYQILDESNDIIQMFSKYESVSSYHSVPTETYYGRLHLNENLFKPSPKCIKVLKEIEEEDLYLYDLFRKDALVEKLSEQLAISERNIFIHNGSAEVIKSICSILLREGDNVLVPAPGWSYYKSVSDVKFAKCIAYEVCEDENSYKYNIEDLMDKCAEYSPRLIVITTPHMPTGCVIDHDQIEMIVNKNPNSVIMLDEAYWGYGDDTNQFERMIITKYSNVVITRTFSKFYGLANIRIGYGLCSYPLQRTIGLDLPLFRASGISRKIAIAALEDVDYYARIKAETIEIREWFACELNKLPGVKAYHSESNFVFIKLEYADADTVRAYMEENKILIRLFTDQEQLRLRITIGPKKLMERTLYQLKKALSNTDASK